MVANRVAGEKFMFSSWHDARPVLEMRAGPPGGINLGSAQPDGDSLTRRNRHPPPAAPSPPAPSRARSAAQGRSASAASGPCRPRPRASRRRAAIRIGDAVAAVLERDVTARTVSASSYFSLLEQRQQLHRTTRGPTQTEPEETGEPKSRRCTMAGRSPMPLTSRSWLTTLQVRVEVRGQPSGLPSRRRI